MPYQSGSGLVRNGSVLKLFFPIQIQQSLFLEIASRKAQIEEPAIEMSVAERAIPLEIAPFADTIDAVSVHAHL